MPEPKLPVVEATNCLINGRTNWPIRAGSPVYSSWQNGRTRVSVLRAGQKVTVTGGVTITRKPGKVVVTRSIPGSDRKTGDIILVYQYLGEGEAHTWEKGVWCDDCSVWTAVGINGGGCGAVDVCDSKWVEYGTYENWVQVKTTNDILGWVLNDGKVFGQLCTG